MFIFILFVLIVIASCDDMSSNILNGRIVTDKRFNGFASLHYKKSGHFCGGVMISKRHVLTAYHCLRRRDVKYINVYVGTYELKPHNKKPNKIVSVNYPKYPNYKNADVAILVLNEDVKNNSIYNIVNKEYKSYNNAISVGFGYTKENGFKLSKALLRTNVDVLSRKQCSDKYHYSKGILCTTGEYNENTKQRNDQCQGDSGGPTFIEEGGVLKVIGITSWGLGCGRKDEYGVQANVYDFRDFINKVIPTPTQRPTEKPTVYNGLPRIYPDM